MKTAILALTLYPETVNKPSRAVFSPLGILLCVCVCVLERRPSKKENTPQFSVTPRADLRAAAGESSPAPRLHSSQRLPEAKLCNSKRTVTLPPEGDPTAHIPTVCNRNVTACPKTSVVSQLCPLDEKPKEKLTRVSIFKVRIIPGRKSQI